MLRYAIAGFFAAAAFCQPAQAVPLDYLGLFTFEAGDAADSSGNGNDGAVIGGVTFEGVGSGHDGGRAVRIDPGVFGVDAGISVPINVNPSSLPSMTWGAWIYAESFGEQSVGKVLSHDNGGYDRTLGLDYRSGTSNSGTTSYATFTGFGVLSASEQAETGKWVHLTATYTPTLTSLYLNGVFYSSAASSFGSGLTSMVIGSNASFPEDFSGLIDDVFIYGRELSSDEIASIHDIGFVAPVPLPAGALLLLSALSFGWLFRSRRSIS